MSDDDKTVEIRLDAVNFVVVGAKSVQEDGKIVTADLVASVRNDLREIKGSVTIQAIVKRSGQDVETFDLAQQPDPANGGPDRHAGELSARKRVVSQHVHLRIPAGHPDLHGGRPHRPSIVVPARAGYR